MGNTQGVSNAASESSEKNHRGHVQAISVIHMKLRKLRHRRKQSRREKTLAQITKVNPTTTNLLKQDEVRDIQVSTNLTKESGYISFSLAAGQAN